MKLYKGLKVILCSNVLILCLLNTVLGQTNISAGIVSGNWTASNSPYIINGDIEVPLGQSLVIEAGTRVEFNGYYGLKVYGALDAIGDSSSLIYFTSMDTVGISLGDSTGRWKGVLLAPSTVMDSVVFKHSVLEFAFSEPDSFVLASSQLTSGNVFAGAVTICDRNNVFISDCLIQRNLGRKEGAYFLPIGAIAAYDSDVIIENNQIKDNLNLSGVRLYFCNNAQVINNEIAENIGGGGTGICISFGGNSLIKENYIHHNKANGTHLHLGGGGILMNKYNENTIVSDNVIVYNESARSGGGIALEYCDGPLIFNNLIANNKVFGGNCGFSDGGGGVHFDTNYKLLFQNNLVVNNESSYQGGAAVLYRSYTDVKIANNVFAHNESNFWGGGLTMFWDSSTCYNNIIWQNYDEGTLENIYFAANYDVSTWRNNLLDNQTSINRGAITTVLDTVNCIFGNPNFVTPSSGTGFLYDGTVGDWNVSPFSLAIDNGYSDTSGLVLIDYSGNNRVVGTIDVGAYESSIISPHQSVKKSSNFVEAYPNPFVNNIFVKINGLEEGEVVEIYAIDLLGKIVDVQTQSITNDHLLLVKGHNLCQGQYVIELRCKDQIVGVLRIVKRR